MVYSKQVVLDTRSQTFVALEAKVSRSQHAQVPEQSFREELQSRTAEITPETAIFEKGDYGPSVLNIGNGLFTSNHSQLAAPLPGQWWKATVITKE